MSGTAFGGILFAIMLALMVVRVPIGIAMFLCGAGGYVALTGNPTALLASLKNLAYARLSNYDLVVIPLFLLMGQFATHGGLSRSLFRFVSAFLGHLRGGVAMAAIGACAGFGAICGSSLATAATMGQVALPELRRFGYSGSLSTGALAAGGTLGIMIPPSVPLVIYAILTEESIGKLFMAAVLPGVIAMLGYMLVVKLIVTWRPAAGPAGPTVPWGERLKALAEVLPVLLVFVVVIVGIYGGWANPTEAAAIGAAACGILAIVGGMRTKGLVESAAGTAQATAMIFLVLLGADMLNATLALSQLPGELAAWVKGSGLSPLLVMVMILAIYIVDLYLSWIGDGLARDDPAHDPDLLPGGDGARLLGHAASGQVDLVRHPCADGGRDRAGPPSGGPQRLHHQPPGPGRPADRDVQGRGPVSGLRCPAHRAAGVFSGSLAHPRPHVHALTRSGETRAHQEVAP